MVVKEEYKSNLTKDEDLDLRPILNFLIRNIKLLSVFFFIGSLLGFLNFLRTPKSWVGEFQIVVSNNEVKLPEATGFARNFLNNAQNQGISTQIIVLKSPSVLLDTFNFVKLENEEPNLRFDIWKKRLSIKQEKESSVLNIKYTDQNQKIILPVLNKVSNLYKDYSNQKRLKSVNLKINYFKEEVKKYTDLTYKSIIKAQDYSKKFAITSSKDNEKEVILVTDQEKNSSIAQTKITEIDQKLKKIGSINDLRNIVFYAELYNLANETLKNFYEINKNLLEYKGQFKEGDIFIIDLEKRKNKILIELKKELINNLQAQREDANIILAANKRDSNVTFNYKKLLIESSKYSKALVNLEKQLLTSNLEKSRDSEPWDLITKPTLIPYYVYPSKIKKVSQFAFISLIIGSFVLYIKEFTNKVVSRNDEIEQLLGTNNLFEISDLEKEKLDNKLNIIYTYSKENIDGKILIDTINIKNTAIDKILYFFKQKKDTQFVLSDKLVNLPKYKYIIPIIQLENTDKRYLKMFKENINKFDIKVLSVIIIKRIKY